MRPSQRFADGTITEGGLVVPMLELAWPLVVIQLLQVTYNVADTLWLGRLSAAAVGALSLAFPVIFFFLSVAGGFTAAGSILVAQYTGARSERSAGMVAGQTLSFVGLLAIGLGLLGFVLAEPVLGLLPADPATRTQVVPLAADYMKLFFLGMPFLFGFFVFSALMRGHGNTRTPMRIMVVSVVCNVVLDPLFIFGVGPFPAMGIEGAAVATVLARGVAALLGFYVLFGTDGGPDVRVTDLWPTPKYIRDIVRVGTPSAVEQSMSALALVSIAAIVVTFSPPVVAAYGLGNRLVSLVFLPAMGLGQATNTMVGQNLGAGNVDRAERAVWMAVKLSVAVLSVIAFFSVVFPEPIVSVFMATGTEQAAATIDYGSEFLRIAAFMFVFMGVLQVLLGAYRGAGNTKTAMIFSMVTLWAGSLAMVYLLVVLVDMGPRGIWIGYSLGDILGAVTAGIWFTRGTWKRSVIDAEASNGTETDSPIDD